MSQMLTDKVAVITGAGRGIGREIANLMAQEGAKVVVNDPGVERDGTGGSTSVADSVVDEIRKAGGIAISSYDTVATMQGGEAIIKTAADNFGRVDILVNNAGLLRDRMIFNMTEEEWDMVMSVNLKGNFTCTKPACILMRQQGNGRIISMSSPVVPHGNLGQTNYTAAKAGILGFIRSVARDMKKYGVTANAIWPHADTRMTLTPEVLARRAKGETTAPKTPRDPLYIAPLIVYLASDQAYNITSQTFEISGGLIFLIGSEEKRMSIYKDGIWTAEELGRIIPNTFGQFFSKGPGNE